MITRTPSSHRLVMSILGANGNDPNQGRFMALDEATSNLFEAVYYPNPVPD